MINSTLTGNSASGGFAGAAFGGAGGSGLGGAIFNLDGTVFVTFSTLAANTVVAGQGAFVNGSANGGAIYSLSYNGAASTGSTSASLTLENSILSNSIGGSDLIVDQPATVSSGLANQSVESTAVLGKNLVMTSSSTNNAPALPAFPFTTNPQLSALTNNGGGTQTMALAAASPAINAAVFATSQPHNDQRGYLRVSGTAPDLGAYEFGATVVVKGSPTVAISSSNPNPSVPGQSYSVLAGTSGGYVPTGTIDVTDGIAHCTIGLPAPGCVLASTTPGSKTLMAKYNGDASNNTATNTATHTVNKGATTTAVTSSANPSVFGQNVTFTATTSATAPATGVPTGSVTFKDGTTTLCNAVTLSAGVATCASSTLSVATHSITAVYSGDTNYVASTSTALSQMVNQAATTTTVTSSANPSTYSQSVTFTASVSATLPVTGTVTFKDGTTTLCNAVTLSSGVATCALSTLSTAAHSIAAIYSGDTNNAASTSTALSQLVNKAATTTSVTSSANPSVFGQNVTFTAIVSATAPATGVPTGTVTFKDGTTTLCNAVTLSAGIATCVSSALAAATHSITVVYSGDTNDVASTSTALSQLVNKAATTTAVTSSANPSLYSQNVTFTATVSATAPATGVPTATVTFKDGTTTLCNSVALSAGVATCASSTLAVATHSITAVYSGDTNDVASTSTALSQVVNKAATTITVTSSANPSNYNQNVMFTATVSATAPATGVPTGTVTFKDDTTTLCNVVALSAGIATCASSTLSTATHSITAVYSGDTNDLTSTSTVLLQVVNKAISTTTLVSYLNPSTFGQSVTFGVNVTGQSPTGTATFKDGTTTLCSAVALNSGLAICASSTLSVGTHTINATYSGDANNAASNATALSQVVNKTTTTTALSTLCMNTFVGGQPFTLAAAASGVTPTGSVTFNNGATVLCNSVTLSSGAASCTVSTLASIGADTKDTYSLTAAYSGDGNNTSSNAAPLTVTVLSAADVIFRSDLEQMLPSCPIE
ncbi:Ig-like domain repeat protein [Pseudolysobacter antarcticus]|uniref:Ig-like domain repeat protein n=1 Tax=Pseudolysobacter antarcticus TaxID=2511995 RepID=A0A411HEX8_9GAMM|nr:Ig-like domain-containing protein [Pseudolysobacter antarcticus]QBB69027.1 Ig-like domain repeat protein [Pseudolysobacter antarcticus]